MKNKLLEKLGKNIKKYQQENRETPWAGSTTFGPDNKHSWNRFTSKSKAKAWIVEQKEISYGMICRIDPDLSKVGHVLNVEYFYKNNWTSYFPVIK